MKQLWKQLATFFHIGFVPIAPGTAASFVTAATVYLIHLISPIQTLHLIIATGIVFLIGIPAASESEKIFQKKDPQPCVIDEVAGQMVGLWFIPHSLLLYIISFFLFRFFDILKPPPVRQAEKIRGGFGIMLDDILAGLYTLGLLHLIRYIFKI